MKKTIVVQQYRSPIRCPKIQRLHLKALGLNRINAKRILEDTPGTWGLINKLPHLVRVIKEVPNEVK